jgi:hypothetical protein
MQKGDRVLVHAVVSFEYDPEVAPDCIAHKPLPKYAWGSSTKVMVRRCSLPPWVGVVVGHTRRATGYGHPGNNEEFNESYLEVDRLHSVWAVESTKNRQYHVPEFCLEEDLEVVE